MEGLADYEGISVLYAAGPNYLIRDFDRYGVAVHDRSEVEVLQGQRRDRSSTQLRLLFLGAAPCTEWLGECIARDEKVFVLTGADGLLETSTLASTWGGSCP